MKVKVGVSARHVHLTKEDVNILFGKNYILTKKADLSQFGQYACNEQITLIGAKNTIKNVRVLGPERNQTQVEISKTDSYKLGINPPVRNSGDLDNAALITIVGPCGQITKKAAIIAARHLHVNKQEQIKYGLINKKNVSIKVNNEKGGILNNVSIRVDDNYSYEVHLDTDDANAFLIKNGDEVEIIIED